ncbi:MAG: hypothetical protein H5T91_07635 [Synergistetes bacterium]|nr:MAG: DNA primase small subunit [bacterium 42_11]MBC7332273.1 hypothetical protein [Synergistota bacterium]MDK2872057.1 hypothetical protein [bacterium]
MEDLKDVLEKAKALIERGEQREAEELLKNRFPAHGVVDSNLHLEAFKTLKALGLNNLAEQELCLSLRDDEENMFALECLIESYIDSGRLDDAERLLKRFLGRRKEKHLYLLLARIYEIQERYEELKALCEEALSLSGDSIFKEILKSLKEKDQEIITEELLVPSEIHLAKYLSLFRGRDGVHARQWVTPRGEVGFTPIREPLTLNQVKNHILGNYTLGIYQLREDNTVCFLAFDIDVAKAELSSYLSSPSVKNRIDQELISLASKISRSFDELGLKSYIEYSGFKGYHVWVLFKKPISALKVREFGLSLMESLRPFPVDVSVELFPKQAYIKSGGLGNLIKLPLGVHKRTGRRSLFVTPDGGPYEDQLSYLLSMELVSEDEFSEACKSLGNLIRTVSVEVLQEDIPQREFILEEDKEFMIIKSRCNVIAKLYEKSKSGFPLTGPEISVITFTLGNLSNGDKVVNSILSLSGVQNKRVYLKSKLSGYPMSCPKIRSKIPEITKDNCTECFAGKNIEGYPTPLLHLKAAEREEPDELVMVMEYIRVRKIFEEAKMELKRVENSIANYMQERGLEKIRVEGYTLKFDGENIILDVG